MKGLAFVLKHKRRAAITRATETGIKRLLYVAGLIFFTLLSCRLISLNTAVGYAVISKHKSLPGAIKASQNEGCILSATVCIKTCI